MRLVLFVLLVFVAGSCAEQNEAPREPEHDVELKQGELKNAENEADKQDFDKVSQQVRNEKRGFRSYFYNYLDEMAMSICASVPSRQAGYILAVRRTCSGSLTCNQICSADFLFSHNNGDWVKQKKWICLESLHVYKSRPVLEDNFVAYTDSYKLGLQVYRYHSCNGPSCGPNYCCCQFN